MFLQQTVAKNNEGNLLRKIAMLEDKLQKSITRQQIINQKEQKWQKVLDIKKQKIVMLEKKMQTLKDEIKMEKKKQKKNKNEKLNDMKMATLKIGMELENNIEKLHNLNIERLHKKEIFEGNKKMFDNKF